MTFVLLEVTCVWLIVQNNRYQGAVYFNSSNRLSASVLSRSKGVSDYFSLKEVNEELAQENTQLREALLDLQQKDTLKTTDTEMATLLPPDSLVRYHYTMSKAIKNTTSGNNNYITINKGSEAGMQKGMGVLSSTGIVGQIKAVSKNFSVIASLLHQKMVVSAKIKRTGNICSVNWKGGDPYTAQLLYVTRHIELQNGDSIVTSGYNAIFPEGALIGTIKSFDVKENASFYDIDIDLSTDFNRLSYVYVLRDRVKQEKDSLENYTLQLNE